jgi:predicted XRE-type DNA-binding protein
MIEFKGERVEVMELSRRYGVPWSTINNRYRAGYRDDDLLERVHRTTFNGKSTTLSQIAEDHGLPLCLVKSRHAVGLRGQELTVRGHLGRGSENAATKLDVGKVAAIKKLLLVSPLNQREIGELFGIDPSHVSDIKRGKRWAKVTIDIEQALGA